MSHPLLKKYLAESLLVLLGLGVGVILFAWFRVWIVGELDTAQFRQIIDLLPKDWRKFASVDFDWLVSYLGRTSTTLDEPMLISLVCAWGIVRGSDVVSGELGRGTMEMLIAQPISRREHYVRHAIYTVVLLAVLLALVWFGMSLGVWTSSVEETTYPEIRIPIADYRIPLRFLKPQTEVVAMVSEVNPLMFLPGIFNLFCIGVFFAALSALVSSIDRYRWRTIGIMIGYYFASAGLKVMGMGSERLAWVESMTIFGLYHPASAIRELELDGMESFRLIQYSDAGEFMGSGTLLNCGLPLLMAAILYYIGLRYFEKRDLPAPV
ncbi:MAG: ABC transporter permease subunit [Planctomycetota bacterium]